MMEYIVLWTKWRGNMISGLMLYLAGLAVVYCCEDGRQFEMDCLKEYFRAINVTMPAAFEKVLDKKIVLNGDRNRRDKQERRSSAAHPDESESPVYGRDVNSPHYGRDTDFSKYGSKRDGVYSEYLGEDLLMADKGPATRAEKILLSPAPVKGSKTRMKRGFWRFLGNDYLKESDFLDFLDFTLSHVRPKRATSGSKTKRRKSPKLLDCAAFPQFVSCSKAGVDKCPSYTVYYVCKVLSAFSQAYGTHICDTNVSRWVATPQHSCKDMARKTRATYDPSSAESTSSHLNLLFSLLLLLSMLYH